MRLRPFDRHCVRRRLRADQEVDVVLDHELLRFALGGLGGVHIVALDDFDGSAADLILVLREPRRDRVVHRAAEQRVRAGERKDDADLNRRHRLRVRGVRRGEQQQCGRNRVLVTRISHLQVAVTMSASIAMQPSW